MLYIVFGDTIVTMASARLILTRGITTTSLSHSKRTFPKYYNPNKRGERLFKEAQKDPTYDIPHDPRGTRPTGYYEGNKWISVPEMIPELIVPSLENFALKPYVTYKAIEKKDKEFTAEDLFYAVYYKKISEDFQSNQLGPNGEPLNPSENEKLTSEEAVIQARQTGSDMFGD